MITFLNYYTQSTLWAHPVADNPAILKMARITKHIAGAINHCKVGDKYLVLPEKKTKFHLFQVGQLLPEIMGLGRKHRGRWVRLDAACEVFDLIAQVYYGRGLMHPSYRVWYQFTDDKNVIFAVAQMKEIGTEIETQTPYLRLYSGAWFNVLRKDLPDDMIKVKSGVVERESDKQEFMEFYHEYSNKRGHVFTWINGYYVTKLTPSNYKVGDVIEMLYDSTVYKKIHTTLSQLNAFDSIMDKKRKYLFTYAGADTHMVDYHDDIDFYLTEGNKQLRTGVYIHRNHVDAVRQITHRDYSITIPYIEGYRKQNPPLVDKDLNTTYIEAFVRRSGFNRKLPFVNNRIHELYKLPYKYKVPAMLGVRSNVKEFRADELEQSAFIEAMSSIEKVTDHKKIEAAFGYNALSVALGDTPTHKDDFNDVAGVRWFRLKEHQIPASTNFEYDDKGKLLGFYKEGESCNYKVRHDETHIVETLTGWGDAIIDDVFNPDDGFVFDNDMDYRVYRCLKDYEHRGVKHWEDITGKYYIVEEGKLKWVEDTRETHTVFVRSSRRFLTRKFNVRLFGGLLTFPINQRIERDSQYVDMKMLVPMGTLDVFLNGHSLVEGIDYFVDFPQVYITSKKYIKGDVEFEPQEVVVRFKGFCDENLKHLPPFETGYIYDGQLSNNLRFNIQDDKVLRIIAAGGTFHRKEVGLFEAKTKNTNPHLMQSEGYPYQVKDNIVDMMQVTGKDTQVMRAESMEIDERVSDYMTQFMEKKTLPQHPKIKQLYALYSPLLCKMLHLIKLNQTGWDYYDLIKRVSKEEIETLFKDIMYLKDVDPLFNDASIDLEYVIIHPHIYNKVWEFDAIQYKFIEKIVKVLFDGKVIINHHLSMSVPSDLSI